METESEITVDDRMFFDFQFRSDYIYVYCSMLKSATGIILVIKKRNAELQLSEENVLWTATVSFYLISTFWIFPKSTNSLCNIIVLASLEEKYLGFSAMFGFKSVSSEGMQSKCAENGMRFLWHFSKLVGMQ